MNHDRTPGFFEFALLLLLGVGLIGIFLWIRNAWPLEGRTDAQPTTSVTPPANALQQVGLTEVNKASQPSGANPSGVKPVRLIVKFKVGTTREQMDALHKQAGAKPLKLLFGTTHTYAVILSAGQNSAAVIKEYQQSGIVDYTELDSELRTETRRTDFPLNPHGASEPPFNPRPDA